jgi:hypothetical protein
VILDRKTLAARGLAMYLGFTRNCEDDCGFQIVAVLYANRMRQYRLRCIRCGYLCVGDILYAKLQPEEMANAPIARNNFSADRKCEHCGEWENGVERHHWAPWSVFGEDAWRWPTSDLCPECHRIWHEKMRVPG